MSAPESATTPCACLMHCTKKLDVSPLADAQLAVCSDRHHLLRIWDHHFAADHCRRPPPHHPGPCMTSAVVSEQINFSLKTCNLTACAAKRGPILQACSQAKVSHWCQIPAGCMQGGSFAYLVPTAAITALIKAREPWSDAADGTNHERFLVSPFPSMRAEAALASLGADGHDVVATAAHSSDLLPHTYRKGNTNPTLYVQTT